MNDPKIRQRIFGDFQGDIALFPKIPRSSSLQFPSEEDKEFLNEVAPYIYEWVEYRKATMQKRIVKNDNPELIFYRNTYEKDSETGITSRVPIVFNSLSVLEEQIDLGAFCWIADCESQGTNEYLLTIDIDLKTRTVTYETLLKYLYEFTEYLDSLHIRYYLVYSGNLSFHIKIPLAYPRNRQGLYGYFLPRTLSFDTLYTRRSEEYPFIILRDALTILIVRYNLENTKYRIVGCDIPRFKKNKRIVFDNRVLTSGGARIPGSYHVRSGGYCRMYQLDTIPKDVAILHEEATREYVRNHPEECLKKPRLGYTQLVDNFKNVMKESNEYYEVNFEKLLYKEELFKNE
jgi:hypothetical protein